MLDDGDAIFVREVETEAATRDAEEHPDADLALSGAAGKHLLESLVLITPQLGADLDARHLVGGDDIALHAVDQEALQAVALVEEA